MKNIGIILALLLISFTSVYANIHRVPSPHTSTIQGGIDSAIDGDTVLVLPGVYYENINFKGKNILVASNFVFDQDTNTIHNTVIDGSDTATVVVFDSNEGSTTTILGFTITHGFGVNGGGIFCELSSPKILYNIIRDNVAKQTYYGPAMHYGGGICCFNCSAVIKYNKIINNQCIADLEVGGGGGGIFYWGKGLPTIGYNLIAFNRVENPYRYRGFGGGIYYGSDSVSASIFNNTIVYNYAGAGGGGIYTYTFVPGTKIYNNVIAFNSEGIRTDIFFYVPLVTYNDIWGNVQGNFNGFPSAVGNTVWGLNHNGVPCDSFYNIIKDPLFVDWANDFTLRSTSFCIDAGDPSSPFDPDSTIADMGAFYYHQNKTYVEENELSISEKSQLLSNYPNPFNPVTNIRYEIHDSEFGEPVRVTLKIYNIQGQLIRTLVDGDKLPGTHNTTWDGKNDLGRDTASGVYFYQLRFKNDSSTKKMILLR